MGPGDPWSDAYLETQQKEQYYFIFINQYPNFYQNSYRD